MRVAYICADPGVPVFGHKGCSIHVQEIILALLKQNIEVHLFATSFGGDPPAHLTNLTLHSLPIILKGEAEIRERVALSINSDLRLELELAEPFDWIYERYSLWSYGAIKYAKDRGIPALLEVNAPLIEEQAKHRGLIHHQQAEEIAKRVFNTATNIIAVSDEVKTYLSQYVQDTDKIHVMKNGVNTERFCLSKINQSSCFTIGFVGSLKPWHGLPILVDAFEKFHQQHPNSKLLIVGDGPQRKHLLSEIISRKLESAVDFTGAVPPQAVPELLATLNVAVAPYPQLEDFYFSPLKIYEYMAAGLPIIASRLGQLTEVIEDGVNGLLCTPGDSTALAIALETLWRSPQLCHRLGQAARQTAQQHHSWDQVVQQILKVVSSHWSLVIGH